ncbi:MAG: siderophore-interacting protein, partial [Betaproteobacteria bacterium]|nr:siderophore-interacting protein [Betaproteobacteria bacterium]
MSRTLGALLLCTVAGWAQAQAAPEALDWLRKIYEATERISYTGTFVYQQGDRTETSRIAHLAGAAGGTDKLEVLDGTPREILRTRDEIRCYLPESRTVKVDRRSDSRAFPALL